MADPPAVERAGRGGVQVSGRLGGMTGARGTQNVAQDTDQNGPGRPVVEGMPIWRGSACGAVGGELPVSARRVDLTL